MRARLRQRAAIASLVVDLLRPVRNVGLFDECDRTRVLDLCRILNAERIDQTPKRTDLLVPLRIVHVVSQLAS